MRILILHLFILLLLLCHMKECIEHCSSSDDEEEVIVNYCENMVFDIQ